ncbi:uncharacterized protein LOC133308378 [Gastrolobium bilobum]|uniref:uncharacterized protein LOC133308378 n=1 Tax=Gastrolobium bilobum TaxID=150636 RepID=UPI002AB0EDD4|nr:uncharacterized protein LOC133308378 [Gastrolobium bilobum]
MAALQVLGLSENVHLHLVIAGLHGSSRLARSVYKNPVRTLVEFTARSKKYLELEQMEIENVDPRQHHSQMEKLGNRRSQIWREVASTEMKRVDRPRPLLNPASLDQSRYCAFHDGPGHTTNECWDLRDAIERYIREGKLHQYLIRTQGWKNNKKRRGGRLMSPPREKKFRDEGRGKKPAKEEDDEFIEPEFECNVISGGFGGGGDTMNAKRKYLREAFQKMNLDVEDLKPCNTALIAFNGRDTIPKGYIELRLTLATKEAYKSERIRFIVADFPSEYNVILGRPTIHDWDMLVTTKHQKLKMIGKQNTVITIPGDQKESRDCYFKSVRAIGSNLKPPVGVNPSNKQDNSKKKGPTSINMVELDMRDETQIPRPEPDGELEEVVIGEKTQTAKIGKGLAEENKVRFTNCLRRNTDVFAWKSSEILGVDPYFCCHKLAVYPGSKPIAQKKRKLSAERRQVLEDHVKELLEAGFIREIQYTTWLSNVVMVKKPNGKWRVCTDYTDLNKVCPKDTYPMPNIDQLVDNSSEFQMLSFMDAYSGYNQIPLHPEDQEKTAFIAEKANYCYNVMPFGLKNSGATYQRMMNQVFEDQLGKNVEVYIDDMIVKSINSAVHIEDLEQTFQKLRQHNICLNPAKCAFGVQAGKFIGFMLTHRGIEANPDKCRAVLEMKPPASKKEIQQLTGRLASLTRFLPRSAETTLPFFKLLRKEVQYGWTSECEVVFQEIKKQLASPPVLSSPRNGETLIIYLSVGDVAANSVLVQESEEGQQPIYFVNRLLQGAELHYQKLEKVAFALMISARRLRSYFQGHQIVVRSDLPIRQILHKPDLAGRMMAWAVELSEFDIVFESRKAIKSQALADFVRELTSIQKEISPNPDTWKIYVDGSSNSKGIGAGVIIENPEGVAVEYSLQMKFETSNNQAEYEAFIARLQQAKELGARKLQIFTDSQLVTSQIGGSYQAKGPLLAKYLDFARQLITEFEKVEVHHIPRNENSRADILSKLASTKGWGNHRTVVEQDIPEPACVMRIAEGKDWRSVIIDYIENGTLPPGRRKLGSWSRTQHYTQ